MREVTALVLALTGCGAASDLLVGPPEKGSSRGSASSSGSGSGTSAVTSCQALETCCTEFAPPNLRGQCAQLGAVGLETECATALEEIQAAGICVGLTIGSGSSAPVPASCTNLTQCCDQLPASAMADCQQVVASDDAVDCDRELSSLATAGFCAGSTLPP